MTTNPLSAIAPGILRKLIGAVDGAGGRGGFTPVRSSVTKCAKHCRESSAIRRNGAETSHRSPSCSHEVKLRGGQARSCHVVQGDRVRRVEGDHCIGAG